MRILHVIPSIGPLRGGPSVAMGLIARALRDAGVDVDVATTNDNDTELLNVPIGEPVPENGVRYWYFARTAQPYTTSTGLARWLRTNTVNYDLVHAHALFSFATSVSASAARKQGVPYIIRPLGTLARYGMQQHSLLKLASWWLVERRLLTNAAAVHFTSDAEREEAERLGRWRSVVVPLGIEQPAATPKRADPGAPLTFLFLSRIHPKKRVDLLLQAFAETRRGIPSARLLIAGTGAQAYVRELNQLATQIGIGEAVTWLGHVTGTDKTRVFEQSHAYVLPSINENFGIAPVEALAAGLPVIVSRGVAIHREVEQYQAGIVVDDTTRSLADAMLQLANLQTLAVMALNARNLARAKFSTANMQRGLLTMYEQVVAA